MLENPPLTPPKRGITNKREIIPLLGGVRGGAYFNTANKSQLELYTISLLLLQAGVDSGYT
jgi:hypothetical protein